MESYCYDSILIIFLGPSFPAEPSLRREDLSCSERMMAHRAEQFVTFSRSDMTLNDRFLHLTRNYANGL